MRKFRPALIGFVLLFVLIIVVIVSLIKNVISPHFQINVNRETVIKEIRSLNRLETASFTIEKVIDGGTTGNAIQQFLVGDRILLIAHGQVIAGFDLSKMSENDIALKGKDVTLMLPAPEILETVMDPSQTRVYDRTHGILNPGDKDLETKVRQEAELSIRQAACQGNILQTASDNARKQLEGLLTSLGFQSVIINIPNGSC